MKQTQSHASWRTDQVTCVRCDDEGVRLVLDGGRFMQLAVQPDGAGADRVRRVLRRVLRVDFRVGAGEVGATVHGIGNRAPCTVPVSITTALSLAGTGTPTTVTSPRHAAPFDQDARHRSSGG